jgi:hypothetical protein
LNYSSKGLAFSFCVFLLSLSVVLFQNALAHAQLSLVSLPAGWLVKTSWKILLGAKLFVLVEYMLFVNNSKGLQPLVTVISLCSIHFLPIIPAVQ